MRRTFLPLLLVVVAVAAMIHAQRLDRLSTGTADSADSEVPALTTPIVSARRAPQWTTGPYADAALAQSVGTALTTVAADGETCVIVSRGTERLVTGNVAASFPTGELQRLVTSVVINEVGSSGFRTEVAIAADTEVDSNEANGENRLIGDVYLIGGGDPGLATGDYVSRFGEQRNFTSFDLLVDNLIEELAARQITAIQGRIVGDDSKYQPSELDYVADRVSVDGQRTRVWTANQRNTNVVGPLSALLVNDGFSDWPADASDPANNRRSTNPARTAAELLDDRLEAAGITISRSPTTGQAPGLTDREILAVTQSEPLDTVLRSALADGTTAEMLFKEYGIRSGGSPERASVAFILAVGGLAQSGLPFSPDDPAIRVVDGSGLSDHNRASCEFLHATISDPEGIGARILPPIGESPLADCAEIDDLQVLGFARGSTTGLAGRIVAANDDQLTFVMLASSRQKSANDPFTSCNDVQRDFLEAVAAYPDRPSDQLIGPMAIGSP